jgi:nicotinate-nucleotide pyrophosphorylase
LSSKNEVHQQVKQLSKVTATSLVNRILKKHGINNKNINTVSSGERAKLKKLLTELQGQTDSLMKKL